MRALRSWLGLLGTLALIGLPGPAGAQPVGEEFQINTYTTSHQRWPSVAADASGNFVVVWESCCSEQDGDQGGVFGQRYDAAGVTLGDEFQVNSYTTSLQRDPAVASDASGNFVVVWEDYGQTSPGAGIFGQRYDSGGGALGTEFPVNANSGLKQKNPVVASDASGNFVVAWEREVSYNDIWAQRYDTAGNPLGNAFRINSYTRGLQSFLSVASDASGNFVVAWDNGRADPGVFGQRFDSEGVKQGDPFRVNTDSTGYYRRTSVASDASGNFVVVWESQDGSEDGIFGQRYDSLGGALGSEFRVNSFTTADQDSPSVASDASGNVVVTWTSDTQDGSGNGVFGQRYDSGGVAQGDEFQINSFTTSNQETSSVVATGTNQFVVAWESRQDGSGIGVFGQRLAFGSGDTITVVSPNTNVKWRIGSLQKIRWTHNLGIPATFRIELDRDDDGDYEELIAAGAPADSATRGHFAWTVTGPPSGTARVRVSWVEEPSVSDTSDVTFQIRPVPLNGER